MNNPPLRDPAGDNWPQSWAQWFTQVFRCLKGWNESFTTTATINFGSIVANFEELAVVTVTGARVGDAVIVQPASATVGVTYDGIVTADDTLNVRAINFRSVAVDPGSMTYRIIVLRN